MRQIRDGAETATTTAEEIRAEIPKYREMAEIITASLVIMTGLVCAVCLVVIARNIGEMGHHAT